MKNMSQNSTFRRIRKKTHQKTSLQWCISKLSEKRQQFFKEKGGFALVIALGLVALITIFTMSILSTLIETIRATRNLESADEAYYAAEGGLEMGLLANKGKSAGFETNGTLDYATINGSKANWTVQGKTTCLLTNSLDPSSCADSNVYYIPRPGSGNASANCDPLQTYADSDNDGTPDANHPCNWGKIGVGDAIAIPLHRATLPGEEGLDNNPSDGVLDPVEMNITSIKLRMRTPCKNATPFCDDADRYDLDTSYDSTFLQGDTIMLWEIVGECEKNDKSDKKICYITQIDDMHSSYGKGLIINSEIYADLINKANSDANYDHTVLTTTESSNTPDYGDDTFGFRGEILYFLKNIKSQYPEYDFSATDTSWDWTKRQIHKPFFNLSLIHSLVNHDGGSIPYLEYQMEIVSDHAVADMYQTVISEGYSNNFKQSVQMKKGYDTGVLKFVIQN